MKIVNVGQPFFFEEGKPLEPKPIYRDIFDPDIVEAALGQPENLIVNDLIGSHTRWNRTTDGRLVPDPGTKSHKLAVAKVNRYKGYNANGMYERMGIDHHGICRVLFIRETIKGEEVSSEFCVGEHWI